MICLSCSTDSMRINISKSGNITCHNCGSFSESGGSSTDKLLTRNASRITDEQVQYEGDTITPYVVDKNTNQAVVNEEFINLYPEQAAQTYNKSELASVGQPDLKPAEVEQDNSGVEFVGDAETAIGDIVGS